MIIEDFAPFVGQHCETTATGSLINHIGLDYSEAMLFGLGQGLGFIYWDTKRMEFPFLGGRSQPGAITDNIVRNLGLQIERNQTASPAKAWRHVKAEIDSGHPVGLQLDCYYLDYFSQKIHFGGHFVAMYGYDDSAAYLVDTVQQGSRVATALQSLALARNARGPMTARNLSYTIARSNGVADLGAAAIRAITANAADFLNPPIANLGYKGIAKAAREVRRWLSRTEKPAEDFTLVADLMEIGGTGGALFRNLYRDFLGECLEKVDSQDLEQGHAMFQEIAPRWTAVAAEIHQAGQTSEQRCLDRAADLLADISAREKAAMERLAKIAP